MLSAGQTLLKLLNDVIEFSQWTTGQPPVKQVHFSVRKVIQEVVQLMWPAMEEKRLIFKVEYWRLSRTVRGDPFRLRQILLHLLSNAIKFTHHGEISILAQGMERTKHDCTLSIAVKDTGTGLVMAASRIFRPLLSNHTIESLPLTPFSILQSYNHPKTVLTVAVIRGCYATLE